MLWQFLFIFATENSSHHLLFQTFKKALQEYDKKLEYTEAGVILNCEQINNLPITLSKYKIRIARMFDNIC